MIKAIKIFVQHKGLNMEDQNKWNFYIPFTQSVNVIQIIFAVVITFMASMTVFQAFTTTPTFPVILTGLLIVISPIVYSSISLWLFIRIGKLDPLARKAQIIFSSVSLLMFPIGTIAHGIILYGLTREETKRSFKLI
ncbi:MAG: hypothetical protein HQL29_04425 [Candidatus Omnitrophica bacterium]|nr:hypothetical protein [Candidatus Omnitrophota bacterium]